MSKIVAHKYKLTSILGQGAFGRVYQAENFTLNRECALKVIKLKDQNQSDITTYQNHTEAFNQNKLANTNIVKVYEVNIHSDKSKFLTIEMEIMSHSLEKSIADNKSMYKMVEFIKQVLYGLEHIHSHKHCHRDIKPANILIANNNRTTKLSDFGLSAIIGDELPENLQPQYLLHASPELYKGQNFSIQTDIYAMGLTLYRCVNLDYDFKNKIASLKDCEKILHQGKIIETLGFDKTVPVQIKRIIKKSCHKNPNTRYNSAQEFRNALERISWNMLWEKQTDYEWVYEDKNDIYKILLKSSRSKHTVFMTKNGRRNNRIIKSQDFTDIDDAKDYMDTEIAKTMVS